MGFSRQEYWSGVPFPSPGDLTDSGVEPGSPALQADALPVGEEFIADKPTEDSGAADSSHSGVTSGVPGGAAQKMSWKSA